MSTKPFQHAPDAPWIFRTYAGHSTAEKSNALYRRNLAAGQTGFRFDAATVARNPAMGALNSGLEALDEGLRQLDGVDHLQLSHARN